MVGMFCTHNIEVHNGYNTPQKLFHECSKNEFVHYCRSTVKKGIQSLKIVYDSDSEKLTLSFCPSSSL